MNEPRLTQRQISLRYAGSADYPGHRHYLRRLRLWLFVGLAASSIIAALTYAGLSKEDAFSPGPISQNHSRFRNNCRTCHLGVDQGSWNLARLMSFASAPKSADSIHRGANSSIEGMDMACLQCHARESLHLPQAAGMGVRAVSSEITVVHATGCAACHREHVGLKRMALPGEQSCASCHGNAEALRHSRETLHLMERRIAPTGENRNVGDGVIRFLTPALPANNLPAFTTYSQGHPGFAWERPGMRDPAILKFNHQRHFRSDLPLVNNHRLTCSDCHQPGPDGVYIQPVKYEQHCARCHTLQFQPSIPQLVIPHGDPEKVRYFLASREVSFGLALRAEGVTDPNELKRRVDFAMKDLERRVLISGRGAGTSAMSPQLDLLTLEERVFFEGDPPDRKDDNIGRASAPKFLTECHKCHPSITRGDAVRAPKIELPNMAHRWIQHGSFNHRPHDHMNCTECHGAALHSTETGDILMPSQKLCAECHRAPVLSMETLHKSTADGLDAQSPAQQRAHGGIEWDCTNCHKFHSPPDAQMILDTLPAGSKPGATKL